VLFSNRNLESHYNVAGVLRAFAIVERRVPEARLIVAGDGGEGPALRAMARELGLKQVEFVGAVRPDEMPALYNRADIFVNASLVDNMPLSILEAFACGLPVVTSCAGGIPLMVEDGRTGVLTPLNDHEAAAAAVMRLLAEQGLADRIIGAARDEGRRHTLSASMPLWRAIYQQLSRNRNGVKGYESSLGEKNRESGTSA
jgi:glycosyltransferase involved in cell wall biosynthesis